MSATHICDLEFDNRTAKIDRSRGVDMAKPWAGKRFDRRKGRASRIYVAIEQIQAAERHLNISDPARKSHELTDDGDIVTRMDEQHFLIMVRKD